MTDDEIVRHNELARAQREAALDCWTWWHCDLSGSTPRYLANRGEERTRIAAKYPLKRRVRREARVGDLTYYRTAGGFIESRGDGGSTGFSQNQQRVEWWRERAAKMRDEATGIDSLVARLFTGAPDDAIEDVTTWDE